LPQCCHMQCHRAGKTEEPLDHVTRLHQLAGLWK
jgi:hypothetical protein